MIEVMIAVTLFSLITLAIYATFRAGLRAMEACDRSTEVLQASRMTLDLLKRDLRSAFFRYEKTYDLNFLRAEQELQKQITRDRYLISQGRTPQLLDPDDPDRKDVYGELNEKGRPVDLSFKGNDGGDLDRLSFVRYYAGGFEPIGMTWHLGRVEYSVEGGNLFRSEKDTFRPEYDFWGKSMPQVKAPKELVARNVEVFDITYSYWFNYEWLTDKSWDSKQKVKRNAMSEFVGVQFEPETEEYELMSFLRRSRVNVREDGLPAYIDIVLGIRPEGRGNQVTYFQTRVLMPTALETFTPFNEGELAILEELGLSGGTY